MIKSLFSISWIVLAFLIFGFQSCQQEVNHSAEEYALSQEIPEIVDFNFHVKPILSDRCFTCHGPDEAVRESDLRFDTEEGAFAAIGKDKDHYAIVRGDVEKSALVSRIFTEDPDDIMPPPESNLSLSNYEKEILKKWIAQGAQWKNHWAFLPLANNVPNVVDELNFVQNDIDRFILKQLQNIDISPSSPATSEQLIRRISFDVTGLPPEIADTDKIIAGEKSIDLYIDELLMTDAYAERMTADWLDLARYSDTHGYQDDLERIMWPWRDWVIHAYKTNMPYDQFVSWQLAGDLLPNPTKEMIIATAFNRNHKITQEGGVIDEEYRVEYVSDRTQTFGTAFLGLSVECAKCHDHKYDPITQKDYYSLFAFFNNVPEVGKIPSYGAIPEPYIDISAAEIEDQLQFINNVDTLKSIPLIIMEEMEEPRATFVLSRGAYDQPRDRVYPNTPKSVLKFDADLPQNRLGLAQWLFDDENPITARVVVNRTWQMLFGNGIVSTSYDFGNQGSLPTHPELLDHLATKFIEFDWDQKALIKYILSSGTYRQSSKTDDFLNTVDPENRLLARSPRKRMTSEMIRDQSLSLSGLLVRTVGGPSVKPYQPQGLWAEKTGGGGGSTSKYVEGEGHDLYRRSIYTFWKRTVPPPSMMTFDAASRDFCIVKRQSTSTPLQALVLLNDPQMVEAARVLADNENLGKDEVSKSISGIFRKVLNRQPDDNELASLLSLYNENIALFAQESEKADEFLSIGAHKTEIHDNADQLAALTYVCLAIMNLDETISLS